MQVGVTQRPTMIKAIEVKQTSAISKSKIAHQAKKKKKKNKKKQRGKRQNKPANQAGQKAEGTRISKQNTTTKKNVRIRFVKPRVASKLRKPQRDRCMHEVVVQSGRPY